MSMMAFHNDGKNDWDDCEDKDYADAIKKIANGNDDDIENVNDNGKMIMMMLNVKIVNEIMFNVAENS